MPNRRKKSNNGPAKLGLVLSLCGAALVVGVMAYVRATPEVKGPTERAEKFTTESSMVEKTKANRDDSVKVMKPHYGENDELKFEETKQPKKPNEDGPRLALNGYLKETNLPGSVNSAKIEGNVLVVDLSKEYAEGLSSDNETLLVNGFLATAKQFKVKSVRFLVNGERLESMGHLDLTQDVPVE